MLAEELFYKDFVVVQLLKAMGCKVVAHYHNKGVTTRQNHIPDKWLYRCFFQKNSSDSTS